MYAERYQPHSTPPTRGHAVTGAQNSVQSPLTPERKRRLPKLKYEALEISEVGEHFERKVLIQYSYFGPLSKQGIYTLQLGFGAHLKAKYFTHYSCYWGPFESVVSLLALYICYWGPF